MTVLPFHPLIHCAPFSISHDMINDIQSHIYCGRSFLRNDCLNLRNRAFSKLKEQPDQLEFRINPIDQTHNTLIEFSFWGNRNPGGGGITGEDSRFSVINRSFFQAESPCSLKRVISRTGALPKWRLYSRLNCEGLSYPTWKAAVAAS